MNTTSTKLNTVAAALGIAMSAALFAPAAMAAPEGWGESNLPNDELIARAQNTGDSRSAEAARAGASSTDSSTAASTYVPQYVRTLREGSGIAPNPAFRSDAAPRTPSNFADMQKDVLPGELGA